MDRAYRRWRREVKIAKRQAVIFGFYKWPKSHLWWTEPGRLDKNNTSCTCLMCRVSRRHGKGCHLHRKNSVMDLEGYDHVFGKANRLARRSETPAFLRRGGYPGTTIKKDGSNFSMDKKWKESILDMLNEWGIVQRQDAGL